MSTNASPHRKRISTLLAAAGLASVAAWAAFSNSTVSTEATSASAGATATADAAGTGPSATPDRSGPQPHIVLFREAPLAGYRGGIGIDSPRNARTGRLDAKGKPARDYLKYLEKRQGDHQARLGRAIGRTLKVDARMQHAVNGIVTELSAAEADAIRKQPDVLLVEAYREYEAETDVGPGLIGATTVWTGVPATVGSGSNSARGEGIVVGILDSGINFGSPSFAAAADDGYVHVNPNGSGNFLGTCAPGGVDAGRCNDKLIGGYDFVCAPPANTCANPNFREEPGFGDTNGHGSHTASTVAGNGRNVSYRGVATRISGVAPRANIIAFDICYTNLTTGQGLCPNVSAVAAVNQAIADGIDVINYSIGGGASPWSESVSQAFLNAVDAGVYVAASAGNSGPAAGTLGHNEPWVASTAAAQHGRKGFDFFLNVTGPGSVPAGLAAVALTPGSGGVDPSSDLPGTTPIVLIPGTAANAGIDGTSDGCAAYPAGTFAGAIAVIRRGTCGFAVKANFARDAGAVAVIIANNQPGLTTPSVPGTTIPVSLVSQVDGNAIRDFYVANGGAATGGIPFPAIVTTNTVDALGAFSSRGPAAFDVLKPDITAPGVNILAVYAGTTITGFENLISLLSGTSMASPHHAGSAALLRQLHPNWTVPEIKSALTMTAKQSVLLEDQVTPANAFGAGAGRVQVDLAARAGLVMNETRARYLAANPAGGGDPSALNQPSMAKDSCVGVCTFVRTVRSTLSFKHQWRLSLTGLPGSVEPAIITLKPGESRQIVVTVDNTGHPADGSWRFGNVTLVPTGSANGSALPALHLPVAVSVPVPVQATPLANGVPVTALAASTGNQRYYTLEVPAGASNLAVTLQGSNGDADLFIRRGTAPTDVAYDCVSAGSTSNESCVVNAPQAGTWYVRIVAFSAYSGLTLTGTYQ